MIVRSVSVVDIKAELKAIPIEKVAAQLGLNLKPAGSAMLGECPTGHPSEGLKCFGLNRDYNYYHCFSCGIGGDNISLVELVMGTDFKGSLSWLCQTFHPELVSRLDGVNGDGPEHDSSYYLRAAIFEKICTFGRKLLYADQGKEGLEYLTKIRGYDKQILEHTDWLYVPDDGEIKSYLSAEYPDNVLAGLPSLKSKDRFIVGLPYRDRWGLITGFILRNANTEGRRWDSTAGTKKTDLFGLHRCKGVGELVIVEGYPDAAIFPTLGLDNVVAVGQGLLSKSHLSGLLNFGIKSTVLSLDNDDVGPGNTEKAITLLQEAGISVRVIDPHLLTPHKDPDELVRSKGVNAFKELIKTARAVNTEWPEPLTFDIYELPAFPTEALPQIGRDMVQTVARVCQVDEGFVGTLYLGALSTAIGNRARVDLTSHQEPTNDYFLPVLDVGERKSIVCMHMMRPINAYEVEEQKRLLPSVTARLSDRRAKEARIARLYKQAAAESDSEKREGAQAEARRLAVELAGTPEPSLPTLITDDITPEKIAELMSENDNTISVISTEAGLFDIIAGRYSDGTPNLDLFLKAHSRDTVKVHRISRKPIILSEPCLTVCLTAQPEIIRNIGKNLQFHKRGLLSRFLYATCQPRAGTRTRQRQGIPDAVSNAYDGHIHSILEMPSKVVSLQLTEEAHNVWDEFYLNIEAEMADGGSLFDFKDWGNKLPGHAARIAGMLHIATHGSEAFKIPISAEIAESACLISIFYLQHALATFGLMRQDPRIEAAKTIYDFLIKKRISAFKVRDILEHKRVFKTVEDTLPGLRVLIDMDIIREKNVNKTGRPGRPEATVYEVNGKIHKP